MRKRSRSVLVVLLVLAGSLAASVWTANANRLSFNSNAYLIRWENRTFRLRESGVQRTAECPVTLEGVLHSTTIPKVTSILIGYIDGATMNACAGNFAGFLTRTLPWHVHYEGFTGTLPDIEALKLEITDATIEFGPSRCLAVASGANPLRLRIGRGREGRLLTVQLVESAIPFTLCSGRLIPVATGTGEVFSFGSGERISLTLI